MKYTLLELVQTVLSSMDSDEVTSITDTVEAEQVAKVIRTVYFDLVSGTDLPEHYGLFNLDESVVLTPTLLVKPSTVDYLEWFHYNSYEESGDDDLWKEVEYLEPKDFIRLSQNFDLSATTTEHFDYSNSGFTTRIYIENNRAPKYWTSFNDSDIICDAFNNTLEENLTQTKTRCYGKLLKTFTISDSFTPELDDQQFALLLNESKALAWAELKQASHSKAEKISRNYRIKLERNKKDLPGKDGWRQSLPNYGRHR